ncbi:MAG: MaoC family dehydratase N-terminal domain-containing protein [SAR324 cluster bacterium]|nr:MaoC family dehydratase N-terminal domain-containing protein [SAR324 cluster bacterium]
MAVERFPIEAGHIMMFARSIGDENPIYHNENYAKKTELGSIIAPPTFVQCSAQYDPDWHLRPKPGEAWLGSGKGPSGISGGAESEGGLHAEQHFEYHRNLLAGDVLKAETMPGKCWEKQGRRGGKLTFTEQITEYRDQKEELVVTVRSVTVKTERPAEKAATGE